MCVSLLSPRVSPRGQGLEIDCSGGLSSLSWEHYTGVCVHSRCSASLCALWNVRARRTWADPPPSPSPSSSGSTGRGSGSSGPSHAGCVERSLPLWGPQKVGTVTLEPKHPDSPKIDSGEREGVTPRRKTVPASLLQPLCLALGLPAASLPLPGAWRLRALHPGLRVPTERPVAHGSCAPAGRQAP